jgi:uncharacterized Tic20 family protein
MPTVERETERRFCVIAHASEALNFQIQIAVALLVGLLLWLAGGLWFFVLFVPNLYALGMALWAAARASDSRRVRYPFTIRLLSGSRA